MKSLALLVILACAAVCSVKAQASNNSTNNTGSEPPPRTRPTAKQIIVGADIDLTNLFRFITNRILIDMAGVGETCGCKELLAPLVAQFNIPPGEQQQQGGAAADTQDTPSANRRDGQNNPV